MTAVVTWWKVFDDGATEDLVAKFLFDTDLGKPPDVALTEIKRTRTGSILASFRSASLLEERILQEYPALQQFDDPA